MTSRTVQAAIVALALVAAPTAFAGELIVLTPTKDNTLYENDSGALSNGSGTRLFTGVTAQPQDRLRRAALAFDVAGSIPAGATILSASLDMQMVMTIVGATDVSLHTLDQDWGEAGSVAGGGQGAGGASNVGDATWMHTFFNTDLWTSPGGDFDPVPSATSSVAGFGPYTWSSSDMADDVQAWLDDPSSNFGWLAVGEELGGITAKAFASREDTLNPPRLTIEFEEEAPPVPATSPWGVVVLALALLAMATYVVRRRATVRVRD